MGLTRKIKYTEKKFEENIITLTGNIGNAEKTELGGKGTTGKKEPRDSDVTGTKRGENFVGGGGELTVLSNALG